MLVFFPSKFFSFGYLIHSPKHSEIIQCEPVTYNIVLYFIKCFSSNNHRVFYCMYCIHIFYFYQIENKTNECVELLHGQGNIFITITQISHESIIWMIIYDIGNFSFSVSMFIDVAKCMHLESMFIDVTKCMHLLCLNCIPIVIIEIIYFEIMCQTIKILMHL